MSKPVYLWQPDVQYNHGDVVEFEGVKYTILQPHRSQSDWTPPITPALWERVPEDSGYHPSYQQPQQPQQPEPWAQPPDPSNAGFNHPQAPPPPQIDHGDDPIKHEERHLGWNQLSPERKKQLEVGGGIAAGLGLLAAGYAAYRHHEKSEEEQKAAAYAAQNWLGGAQARTESAQAGGITSPTWCLVRGKEIPPGAVQGGEEQGHPIYVCRSFFEHSLQPGKASSWFKQGAVIGYGSREHHTDTYEVLVADPRSIQWVDVSHKGTFNVGKLNGARPVEGGHEADGTPLFIAQGHYHNCVNPGKVREGFGGAFIPYDNDEKEVNEYRVLCYA